MKNLKRIHPLVPCLYTRDFEFSGNFLIKDEKNALNVELMKKAKNKLFAEQLDMTIKANKKRTSCKSFVDVLDLVEWWR
jgi:hypothetical protein